MTGQLLALQAVVDRLQEGPSEMPSEAVRDIVREAWPRVVVRNALDEAMQAFWRMVRAVVPEVDGGQGFDLLGCYQERHRAT